MVLIRGIEIDYKKDEILSEQAKKLLEQYYLHIGENSPQERFAIAALTYTNKKLAQRIYDYVSKGWFMFSTPILSNASLDEIKGMPISCFLTYVSDTLEGLIEHSTEIRWMSVKGGGVGGHWSDVRAVSDIAPGPIPFIHTIDSDVGAYRQGKTRRSSYAAYIDISHPDIIEFLNIRVPTGGDINRKCFNIHNAINITDDFMSAVVNNKEWNLVDPNTKNIRDIVNARELWQRILETRFRTGEPYLFFIDTANKCLPHEMKEAGLKINGSNLCNEISLPTNEERSAVCCLSSLNLEKYNEWKDTDIIGDVIEFLDDVIQYFIDNAPKELSKAINSAIHERSLGLGVMGFHSYLQSKNIPFESAIAKSLNNSIFKHIKEKAFERTTKLSIEKGSCKDVQGVRNAHLLAIAPNANSSIIAGTSASIDPIKSNAYVHRTRIGSHLIKNKYLEKVLISLGQNTDEVWNSIISNSGSIQHLEFLNDYEKEVFKTAFEINQRWVIEHAADRQKYLCQSQSVNLYFPGGSNKSYVNKVHLDAWEKGMKGLYYLRTESEKKAESVNSKIERIALKDYDECIACQG